jgi:hypothetical protein
MREDAASRPAGRWQFSLRALMLFTLAVAVLAGMWKIAGTSVLLWASFGLFLTAPMIVLAGTTRTAFLAALSAVYGPFVVMATYTYLFVDCSHCKKTTWALLPCEPGLIPLEVARRWLDFPRLGSDLEPVASFLIAVAMVIGLTWVLRTRGWWWRVCSVFAMLVLCSYCAFVVLALVRA